MGRGVGACALSEKMLRQILISIAAVRETYAETSSTAGSPPRHSMAAAWPQTGVVIGTGQMTSAAWYGSCRPSERGINCVQARCDHDTYNG